MDDYDSKINEAKEFLKLSSDAESNNRQEGLDDLKFAAGDQWPVEIQNSRNLESRPCLTINKIDAYVRQITNQQRQQRPRIKVDPINSEADAKVAEVITGICRHVEVNSNADDAYDTAFDFAVRMGWGYWRVVTDYVSENSFDQEIYIKPIDNPFTVYFDPNSNMPDGSDAEKCLITTVVPKSVFRKMYPDADDGTSFTARGTGDSNAEWVMKEDIRIAEYFYTERKRTKLVMLSDGSQVFEDELPDEKMLASAGITIVDRRDSYKKVIKWCKLTAIEVLEEKDWPGKYIPVVPVYGQQLIVDSKRKRFGLVRMAKDPQRMYNYWQTTMTESVALAPKAKWLMAEGQNEGHENDWANANQKSMPVLLYKQTDISGVQAPPPQRLQPEPPPAGVMAAAGAISLDLQAVIGIVDPNQLPQGNISGKALQGQQAQIDMSNFHYFDNLTRSIKQTGKIILDLIPKIYDTQRVMRIIGDDGKPDLVTINEQQAVGTVLNDVTVGEYDVTMDTGPGYNSKRQAAVDAMMPLIGGNQKLMDIAGDLVFRNMDFPGADTIADRLAASNPLAQIDNKSPIPPQVQMQLAQSKQMIQQMQQQMQQMQLQLKYRGDIEQMRNDTVLKKAQMDATVKAHGIDTKAQTDESTARMKVDVAAHDTTIDNQTKIKIENIKAQLAMMLASIDERDVALAKEEAIERGI
jgi:hypothetical protein